MAIAEYMQKRADGRTQLELRVSLSLWALLVAVTLYVQKRPPEWVLVSLLTVIVIGHAYFCFSVRIRSRTDIERSFWYVDQARALLWAPKEALPTEPLRVDRLNWRGRLRDFHKDLWSDGVFIGATILMALVTYFTLGNGYARLGP